MDYIGEHLLPGKLGHFFSILSFAASFVAMVAYFKATNAKVPEEENSWKKLARGAFAIDIVSVFSVFAIILYVVSNHLFEYNYAWEHSGRSMSMKYLLACIWEAQEGSFLLWTMWHCVLGAVLIFTAKKWEAPVMTVISGVQLCLATMIMGLYFFGDKVGINAFLLVREKFAEGPMFSRPDYLSLPQMQDGQGLNALLQNYWMTIHPPVLFLGFASTIVPFAFAIAGLWKKQYGDWIKKALPWTLFSCCILGTGIMMGAAWAYESLSFGGYWAWDPVENASLVPWLVLVAGLHTQVVYNATGHSLRATYLFLLLGFIFTLYATFLTRSGILGDASVHSFVGSDMMSQLIIFVLVFLIPAAYLFISRYKKIPHIVKEESTDSREFWMFIGALVIFLSSLFIIITTSLPVINKIFGSKFSEGSDREFAYNRIEVFIAILLGLFTAIAQYLKYKNTKKDTFLKKIALPTAIALVISILISIFGEVRYDKYGMGFLIAIHLAIFAAVYAIAANAAYIRTGLNGKLKAAGGSIAHLGFGLLLLGILISSSRKAVLSYNTTGINLNFDPGAKENPLENITLLKSVKTDMGKYWATYIDGDSVNARDKTMYFHVNFRKKDDGEVFDLYPNWIRSTKGQESISANPDKHHYWNRDIFTYISASNNMEQQAEDTVQFRNYPVAIHDTIYYSRGYMVLDRVVVNPDSGKYHFTPSDTALMAEVRVFSKDSVRSMVRPLFYLKDNQYHWVADTVFSQGLAVRFNKVVGNNKIELGVKESSSMVPFVALKVYEFPHINIVWIGVMVMMIGFVMSIARRYKLSGG